ncbi:hypothetical protein PROFUN_15228 [Planoprotostelium fungivorum]|uniref:Uncharacterized protein n=1 Tax=Planoprotostelium fungivorum TaxID=1890364 RepID=A0A2P6MWT4_9EUKA|nr:hypothetical protein PROFUN_15228 [Planoprotostelium fungivorum]
MAVVRDRAPSITVISVRLLLTLFVLSYLLVAPIDLYLHLLVLSLLFPDPRHLILPLVESPITLAKAVVVFCLDSWLGKKTLSLYKLPEDSGGLKAQSS